MYLHIHRINLRKHFIDVETQILLTYFIYYSSVDVEDPLLFSYPSDKSNKEEIKKK